MGYADSETIIIKPLSQLIPGATFVTEENCVGFQLTYNATGGSFSISLLQGSVHPLPQENAVLSLPFGRVGIVKQVGSGWSGGGLVDTISGPILPLVATEQTFYGEVVNQNSNLSLLAVQVANGGSVHWETLDVPLKNFSFRGISLSGIQSVASVMLADVIVRKDGIYVVDPGAIVGNEPFVVPKSDIVQAQQTIDYSLDIASVLNPTFININAGLPEVFIYDSDHAQKQPKFTVQAGAPGSEASKDFIPIPDGWLVDGNYEEWTPPNAADFTNPSSTVDNRYWKVFQSPSSGGLRGITSFTRLVKELKLPNNVSPWVGSPVTALTKKGTSKEFVFDADSTNNGIYGFQTGEVTLFDIVSHQYYTFKNAIVLRPAFGVGSGEAKSNFYSTTMELWTFPLVAPVTFTSSGGPNPFNTPKNVVIVTPNSNVILSYPGSGGNISTYPNKYLANYKRINSPRLKTSISTVFRNYLPQVGDQLTVPVGLTHVDCGRIQSVGLSFGRSGIVLSISAEKYQFGPGLYQFVGGGTGPSL